MWDPSEITPIGKTFAEIDQEQKQYVDQANVELRNRPNADARWWLYSVSHQTFNLLVGKPNSNSNIVLSLTGCKHISGPVGWRNQRLVVKWINSPPSEERCWLFEVIDNSAAFHIKSATFDWQQGFDLLDKVSMRWNRNDKFSKRNL